MQVTVFGAAGKVGQQVVAALGADGHRVVAFVHNRNPFKGQPGVRVIQGSIADARAVSLAITDSQAVISALGSWGSSTKDVVSTGTTRIVKAMADQKVTRLITLTGGSAFCAQDRPNILDKLTHGLLGLASPKILSDGELHLQALEASQLDWTCIRSPIMTRGASCSYKLSRRLPFMLATIPRRAVVKCLVDQLTDAEHLGMAPVIRRV